MVFALNSRVAVASGGARRDRVSGPRYGATEDAFVWRRGRSEVSVRREGGYWTVVYTAAGRLLGPRQVIYEKHHQRATHAAWDVMARVIRVSRDETEAMRAAQSAVRWMRDSADVNGPDSDV